MRSSILRALLGAVAAVLVSAQAAGGATIAGTVTHDAAALNAICVDAYEATQPDWMPAVEQATTNAFGQYGMTVAAGTYKVAFSDCSLSPQYVREFWNDQQQRENATIVDVSSADALNINADLALGHTISGRVTSDGSTGIANICVQAHAAGGSYPSWGYGNAATDLNGDYTTQPIPYGHWKMKFEDCNSSPTYVTRWYFEKGDFAAADDIDLTSVNRTGIDAVMAVGHKISGRVTSNGSDGIEHVCVGVWSGASGPQMFDAGTQTQADGSYATAPLADGSYRVQLNDCSPTPSYIGEWYDDKNDQANATAVPIAGADAGGVDAILAPGHTISGRVTSNGTDPIAGICINVQAAGSPGQAVAWAMTDAGGDYTTSPVAAGSYVLGFSDCSPTPVYVPEWWDNATSPQGATPISVSDSNVSGKDAVLNAGHTVSGHVTNAGGDPLQGICVNVNLPPPSIGGGFAQTDASGNFRTSPVAPGSYQVQFVDCRPSPGYITEWWNDKHSGQTPDLVDLTSTDQTAISPVLTSGYVVSGHVTNTGGTPLQGICVNVVPPGQPFAMPVSTNASGDYAAVVAPGTYNVGFFDCQNNTYVPEWYDDKLDVSQATAVEVTGANRPGIDAQLATGTFIEGTITADGGGPLSGCVGAALYTLASGGDGNWAYAAVADAAGHYRLGPLPRDRDYKVGFGSCPGSTTPYFREWYDNGSTFADGQTVNTSADHAGVDAQLTRGRTISGHVSAAAGGAPLANICVGAWDAAGSGENEPVAGAATDADGAYTIGPLHDGQYKLLYGDCGQPVHVGEWFHDKGDFATANAVDVTTADASGIDEDLAVGKTVSGRVTNAGAAGIQNICVNLYGVGGDPDGQPDASTQTDADGDYVVGAVPAGTYKLSLNDCNDTPLYIGEWYDDQGGFATATPIDLTGPSATGVDAVLARGYTIAGHVTSGGAAPIANVCTEVVSATEEGVSVAWGTTDAGGDYRTNPVPPGTYKLRFDDCSATPSWISEYFDNHDRNDWANATVITVVAADRTGINAVLAPGHSISGRVTSTGGGGVEGVCPDLMDAITGEWIGSGCSDQDGYYVSEVVPPGHYKVAFNDDNGIYISEWWNDKLTFETGDDVDLTTTNRTLDAVLGHGGAITGTVRAGTNGSGTPLAGMCVDAQPESGAGGGGGQSGPDGTYRAGGLRTGTYTVSFYDCREAAPEGRYHPYSIEHVPVTAPNDTPGVNANMGAPDNVAPDTFITSAPTGWTDRTSAAFAFAADEPAGFECRLDSGDWDQCADNPLGLTGLANGQHTLQVRARDAVDQVDATPATATWTVDTSTPLTSHETRGTLPGTGGSVSDDALDQGATSGDPVRTAVSAPGAGTITILEEPAAGSPPTGWSFFGRQVRLTSTVATTANSPLEIAFTLDATLIPAGKTLDAIAIFRNGAVVATCTGAPDAVPDPCVLSRESLAGGDVRITILSSAASTWNFGTAEETTPAPPAVPGTPMGDPTLTTSALTVSWAGAGGAASYTLAYRDLDDADWTQVADGITATSYAFPAAAPEGTLTFRVKAVNAAGSSDWSPTSGAVLVDRTAPRPPVAATDRMAEDTAGGWFRDTLTVSFAAAGDPGPDGEGSGIDATSLPAPQAFTDTGMHTASATVRDRAGNTSSAAAVTVKVDAAAPQISISCPAAVAQGATAGAHWTASDLGAGLVTPAAGDVVLDSATVGTRTAAAPGARDAVGHAVAGATCGYAVTAKPPAAVPTPRIVTRKVTATRKGDIAIKLACTKAACRGKLTLVAKIRTKTVKLGAKTFSISAGARKTVKIRLSKANLRKLKAARRLRVKASVRLAGTTRNQATATVTVSAPKR